MLLFEGRLEVVRFALMCDSDKASVHEGNGQLFDTGVRTWARKWCQGGICDALELRCSSLITDSRFILASAGGALSVSDLR